MSFVQHLLSLSREELTREFASLGEKPYRAEQLWSWLYLKRVFDFAQMSDLSAALREKLAGGFFIRSLEKDRVTGSKDTTQKFLFRLQDGQMVETVLIPASPSLYGEKSDRRTICISSQVGCAYGCKFCASGIDGWKRNLTAGEIVEQFLAVEEYSDEKINNIVFMGMGEPFANFENLMKAINILNAPKGIALGARHMTVSTSGLVPRIRDFADQPLQIRLAISFHGATDEVRSQIMPVNRKYPVAELLEACAYFAARKKQRLTFEYILIKGVNDTEAQAVALAKHAKALNAKVNLIPYNTVMDLDWERPSVPVQERFLAILQERGVVSTLRREKGHDIAAACGQLRLQASREKRVAPVDAVQ
ncbi:23S rRNA (adenine(2503)-C(2))-methyltransferase RlmN [soil metagenome]